MSPMEPLHDADGEAVERAAQALPESYEIKAWRFSVHQETGGGLLAAERALGRILFADVFRHR